MLSLPSLSLRVCLLVLAGSTAASLMPSCLTPNAEFGDSSGPVSEGGTAAAPSDHCENRTVDKDESDTDCGGLDCPPCEVGQGCAVNSDCVNEECTAEVCIAASCNDDVQNGGETDIDCGGDACLVCLAGASCLEPTDCDSLLCKGGECLEASCSDRVKNGAESDIDCGGPECGPCDVGDACLETEDCAQPSAGDLALSLCENNVCELSCPVGLGDCNQQAADGCEISLNSDVNHCGACAETCDPENTTAAKCVAGACLIDKETENGGCSGDWLDCNGEPSDGCEVNSNTDPQNCGGCGSDYECSDRNGAPSCVAKTCATTCNEGFADCDDDVLSNGCETNIGTNVAFCGGCDAVVNRCDEGGVDESPNCVSGVCGLTPCDNGTGDCDGDGTCLDILNTLTNCGACGNTCGATNATTRCVDQGSDNYACDIDACLDSGGSDFENCDGRYETGCKTDVNVNPAHCGTCGNDCGALQANGALEISAISCLNAECTIAGCNGTFVDCDGVATNGCEIDTARDAVRCGGCLDSDEIAGSGITCSTKPNTTTSCSNSACTWTCALGFGDVDEDLRSSDSNGCEEPIEACEAPYEAGSFYVETNLVSYEGKNYRCNTDNCRNVGCDPGVMCSWGFTWDDLGLCDPRL